MKKVNYKKDMFKQKKEYKQDTSSDIYLENSRKEFDEYIKLRNEDLKRREDDVEKRESNINEIENTIFFEKLKELLK